MKVIGIQFSALRIFWQIAKIVEQANVAKRSNSETLKSTDLHYKILFPM